MATVTIPQQLQQLLDGQKALDAKVTAIAGTVIAMAQVLGVQDLGPEAQAIAGQLKQSSDALKAAVDANKPK